MHANRWTGCGWFLAGLLAAAVQAQTTTQPLLGVTDEQTAKLVRSRAVIENPADSESTRQAQAEELLLTGWPAAADLLIALLETSNDGTTRAVVCRAVGRVESANPELVDRRLIESLIGLLADGDPSVSTAASAALSSFRDDYVVRRLGELARDPGRPVGLRLAAIEALAPNIDRRCVIEQLMELLHLEEAVRDRALAALVPASRVNYGRSVEAWEAWWQDKSALEETAWLRDRVTLFAQRARDLELRLETLTRESESHAKVLARRLADALRMTYRLTAQEAQRDELLIGWLRDPLIEFRRTAVDLVKEQIYDQKRPSEGVRAALRERYTDTSPELRREVFELVAALNEPADMEPVLARLAVETDLSVRETILGVLGKLRNPAAILVLIDEIAEASSPSPCLAKAAQSLALLARESNDPALLDRAVGPLRTRLAAAGPEDVALRGALLGAMAGIGSAAFTEEFVAHLGEEQPELLLPAIRGTVAVQDRDQLNRLRTLFLHADARVRLQAMEAVGVLGDGEGPLEALLNPLNVATEPNEAVRSAAWVAFCRILKRQPADARLKWVGRLKDLPGRQIEYLSALVEDFASANPVPGQLGEVRAQLARLLREQKRYAESVRPLQELYTPLSAGGDSRAGEFGVLLLDSLLRDGQHSERIEQLLPELAKHGDDVKAEVVRTITAYMNETMAGNANPELAVLAGRLREACNGLYGQRFDDYLTGVVHQLAAPPSSGPVNPS
ncbi:MAG: HEAT repeat domain-containing protein [Planctomycetota bacterium]